MSAIIQCCPVVFPPFSKNRVRIILIATALNAGFLAHCPQPSCSRDVELKHQGLCLLTVANEALSELPEPTSEKNEQESNIIQKFSQEHNRRKFQGPGT